MSTGAIIGGVALAAGLGLVAGTAYFAQDPKRVSNPLVLGGLVGVGGVALGLVLHSKYPSLAKGLIGGGAAAGLLSTPAAKVGVFYVALNEIAHFLPQKSSSTPTV